MTTEFANGDFVIAAASGTAPWARGYGRAAYNAGDELLITSRAARTTLNVKRFGKGSVFTIPRDKVRSASRQVGEIPEGSIAPDDPRIAWLFEDAGRLAERLGLCRDYDRLCDALGAPGRVRTFTMKFADSENGVEITAKVQARSRKQAETILRGQIADPTQEIKAIAS